jgi:integrase
MRVNIEVKLTEKECWLLLGSEIEKDHTPLEYTVPPELVPYIRHYLTITRPALLNGGTHNAMWVGSQGQPLTLAAIASMIGRLSSAELGGRFGAHQFRRELATGLAEAEPHNPGLAAAILGIGIEVAEKHYIVARDHEAGRHVADHLAAERERTRLLAERLFRDGR